MATTVILKHLTQISCLGKFMILYCVFHFFVVDYYGYGEHFEKKNVANLGMINFVLGKY